MARLLNAVVGLSFASIALASPLSSQIRPRQNGTSPCAQVSASVATQTAAVPTVPAQLAYECITSVPFNQSAALALVDGVVPYFKWQSTTVWLKDPPAEYVEKIQDPVDVWGGLDKIRQKVVGNAYKNEFEVMTMPHVYKYRHKLTISSLVSNSTAFYRLHTTVTLSTSQTC